MNRDLEQAVEELRLHNATFVVVKEGAVLGMGRGRGVGELVASADELGGRARGGALADRIVGKAAAFVAEAMGISSVHAALLSEPGRDVLLRAGIKVRYETLVPAIRNRAGDGSCPMELLVEDCREAADALTLLRARVTGELPGGTRVP